MKPENVFVRRDGVAKVLDFGIAKQIAMLAQVARTTRRLAESISQWTTGEGVVSGTPYYMSPEQMKGSRVDARTDQFSWGVLAYELVCGVPPWGTQLGPVHVVAAILGTDPTDPHAVNPEVPEWLASILLRAIAKAEEARFPSMHEVVALLETGATGPAGQGSPRGGAMRGTRTRIGVVLAILVSLVAGGALLRAHRVGARRGTAPARSEREAPSRRGRPSER